MGTLKRVELNSIYEYMSMIGQFWTSNFYTFHLEITSSGIVWLLIHYQSSPLIYIFIHIFTSF